MSSNILLVSLPVERYYTSLGVTLNLRLHLSSVFDWHYVQCVLRRCATEEYWSLHNIAHFSFPFGTRDDDGSD